MNRMATTTTDRDADDISRAEAQVRLSRAELSRSVRRVGESSQDLVRRVGHELKPTLAVAAAVAGAAVVVGVTVVLVQRKRQQRWFGPAQESKLGSAAKVAGLWALRFLARRVAQELVSRLGVPPVAEPPRLAQ